MSMTIWLSRTNYRIHASVEDWFRAWQNPESASRREEKEPRSEEREMHLVVGHEESRVLRTKE